MKMSYFWLALCLSLLPCGSSAQILSPELLTKPPTDAWPTYNGDYSGRRFSTLTQINQSNVMHLTPAWIFRVKSGPNSEAIIGGEGPASAEGTSGSGVVKATPLMVNGILYFSTSDNAWA